MTEQEKREKAIEEMSVILEKQYLTDCKACLSEEQDCFHCCAKELYDFILKREEEVRNETAKKLLTEITKPANTRTRLGGYVEYVLYVDDINKLAKEFGLEAEE